MEELFDPLADLGQLTLNAGAVARLRPGAAAPLGQSEHLCNVAEPEAQQPAIADEAQPTHIVFAIEPVTASTRGLIVPRSFGNQADLFIVTGIFRGHAACSCGLADRERLLAH